MSGTGLDIRDFGGSWITLAPAFALDRNQHPRADNIDPTRGVTSAVKRKGFAKHSRTFAAPSGTKISGLFRWIQNDGTAWNLATEGTKIWRYTSSAETDITGAATITADALSSFAVLNNKLVIATGGTPLVWTGSGNVANLGGTPPTDAIVARSVGGRMFLARANSSNVQYSAYEDPEDYTTSDNAGNFDANKADGDTIKAMEVADGLLYIFKRSRTYILRGTSSIDTFAGADEPRWFDGATNKNACVSIGHYCFFAGDQGIYMANGHEISEVSARIQDTYDAIANKSTIALGRIGNRMLLVSYDSDGDAVNDACLVLDYRRGAWAKWTGIPARMWASLEDGQPIFGSPSAVLTYAGNSGTNDDSVAINMVVETPDIYNPHFHRDKSFRAFWLLVEKTGAYDVTVKVCYEGNTASYTTLTPTLTVGTGTGLNYERYTIPNKRTKFARFQISNNTADQEIKLHGYGVEYDEYEGTR